MKRSRLRKSFLSIASAMLASLASPVFANEFSYFTTVYDTDFTTAGVGGLRSLGTGTLSVSGVSGPVTQSYLYWAGPTNSSDPNANANVSVGGSPVTGTNIGFSGDNFWGHDNSQAYRANTTSVITGNGSYALSGFDRTSDDSKTAGTDVNGAGALVFFNNPISSDKRDVVVFNGNDSNFASSYDPAGWDFALNGIKYTSGEAFLTLMVSDGQNFGPDDDGTISINGLPLISGGIFQGDSLPGPSIGNGNLWDIKSFDITSFLTPGTNDLNVTLGPGFDDAIGGIVAAVDLPAGSAPIVSAVPLPAALPMFGAAILALGAVGYRMKRKSAM